MTPKDVRSIRYQSAQRDNHTAADGKELVRGDGAETDIDGTLQSGGEGDRLQRRTEHVIGEADDAKGDADGHQHLRQFRSAVNPPVEKTFQRNGNDDRAKHGNHDRQAIAKPEIARRIGSDIAPDHGECAVGEVDHPHQAHRHRQANRDDEQDHPVGQGIDANAEERLHQIIPVLGTGYFAAANPGSGCFSNVLISLLK